jgi:hypothetical protein
MEMHELCQFEVTSRGTRQLCDSKGVNPFLATRKFEP